MNYSYIYILILRILITESQNPFFALN